MTQINGFVALLAFVVALMDATRPSAFTAAVAGSWKGTLEYRDYSNDKRVTLPTTLEAQTGEDGRALILKFRYDEGRNRFVESKSTLRIDARSETLTWESEGGKTSEYKLAGLDSFADKKQGALILTGQTIENDASVEARLTISVKGDDFSILKETRKPGAEFAFRNEYRFGKDVSVKVEPGKP